MKGTLNAGRVIFNKDYHADEWKKFCRRSKFSCRGGKGGRVCVQYFIIIVQGS